MFINSYLNVWETDIKEDLRIKEIYDWTKLIQDGVKWKEVDEKGKTNTEVVAPEEEEEEEENEEEEEEEKEKKKKNGLSRHSQSSMGPEKVLCPQQYAIAPYRKPVESNYYRNQ